MCAGCEQRRIREKNPVKTRYDNLRMNAKRRGKEFTLSYSAFCLKVAKDVTLMPGGRTSVSFSIDRINPAKGYTDDNIQVMEYGSNAAIGDKSKCTPVVWGLTVEWKVYTHFVADVVPF